MTAGGARNRSGPPPNLNSGRSDRRGLSLRALPAGGYLGEMPTFPLPKMSRYRWEFEDKKRYQVFDEVLTEKFRERELAHWVWAWRTPQAVAWLEPQESWRAPSVAEWCRVKATLELDDAPTGLWAAKFRLEDRIMFSNAGLIEAGYQVAADEVGDKRAENDAEPVKQSSRDRLKVVSGGA